MGADGSAYVVLGIGITRTTFFLTEDVGIQCPKGHKPHKADAKFCDECGGRFGKSSREIPTPAFKAWAESLEQDPDEIWDMLNEGGYTVGLNGLRHELRVHHMAAIESSERNESSLALGFKLLGQGSEGSGSSPNTYELTDLNTRAGFLEELAKELRIEFLLPVKLHLTYYWSV